jgi:Fe2+ or Zn2+ uptake regulation protein
MARAARRPVRPARRPRVVRVAPPPVRPAGVALAEDPHAHVVCRVCGRIQGLELNELDRHLLTELAALHPDGWSVERVAFSLTGACRLCREGPTVR